MRKHAVRGNTASGCCKLVGINIATLPERKEKPHDPVAFFQLDHFLTDIFDYPSTVGKRNQLMADTHIDRDQISVI